MERFTRIENRVAKTVGGAAALQELLPKPKSPRTIARLTDAACLSAFARAIFGAGFQPKIVEHMWPGIEAAFRGFDPLKVARLSDAQLKTMAKDTRVVRHRGKLTAIRDTARFVVSAAAEHRGFGKLVSRWPTNNIVGLWDVFRTGGRWLGWATAATVLRFLGKDTFVLGRAATNALVEQGILRGAAASKRDVKAAQEAFNTWADQTGRPLCQLSKILALS